MAIDLIGRLVDRIMNKTNLRTFNRYRASLESISEGEITHMGFTDLAGAATGLTIVDTALAAFPEYGGQQVKVLDTPSAGQIRTIRFHVGNTLIVDRPFTDAAGAIATIPANCAYVIISNYWGTGASLIEQISHPEMEHYEGWQDELGIDFTLWSVTHPATPWVRGAGAGVAAPFLVAWAPLLINEVARLVGNQRWQQAPDTWGANTIVRRSIFEFEMTLSDVTQLVPGTCFFGLTPNQADTRANNNIIGFALVGAAPAQALQTVTDLAGVETVNTGFGENLALYNKFRIDVVTPLVLGVPVPTVNFYLNEVLLATHIANLPDLAMYINWYFDTTALGACTPQIGVNRLWTEDYQRV